MNKLVMSFFNLLAPSMMFWVRSLSIEKAVKLALWTGYDGIEYAPIRGRLSAQVLEEEIDARSLPFVLSGHQSFRSERSLGDVLRHPNPLLAGFASLTLPERNASLVHLQLLQVLEPTIPMVVYPPHEDAIIGGKRWGEPESSRFRRLRNKLVQPEPGLLDRWNAENSPQLVEMAMKRGYSGFALDLYHLRREPAQGFQRRFENWREAIPVMLPFTREIHLRISSPAERFRGPMSERELSALLEGTSGEIVEMMRFILEQGWEGNWVVEAPFGVLDRFLFANVRRFIAVHTNLTNALRLILQG